MIRNIYLPILFLCFSAIVCEARTIRVLAIGNSFSEDAIEQNLYELAAASGDTAVIGNLCIGGCELQKHAYNAIHDAPAYRYRKIDTDGHMTQTDRMTIKAALSDDAWDIVTLQQASHYSGIPDSYTPWLKMLADYVRENTTNDPVIGFHQTWAYASTASHWAFVYYKNSQTEMYNKICEATQQAMDEAGISLVIPTGTAIQNCRATSLGDNLNRDGYHLDLKIGRYIAACTWYCALFNKNIIDNSYCPDSVDSQDASIARLAAKAAVGSPWKADVIIPSL